MLIQKNLRELALNAAIAFFQAKNGVVVDLANNNKRVGLLELSSQIYNWLLIGESK